MANGDELRGVNGWLAFFIVTLGIINPAFLIYSDIATLNDPDMRFAYGSSWNTIVTGELAITAVALAACWFACYRLLKVFNPTSVRIAIGTLWLLALLLLVAEPLMISSVMGVSLGVLFQAMGPVLIRPIVYSTIWTLYLLNSKRVKNTYYGVNAQENVGEVFS